MGWKIPDIPDKKEAPKPNYRLRGILFIPMAVAGIFFSLFTLNVTSYFEVMFYGILPVGLLWMCFMGVSINRYQQSLNDVLIWNEEKEITKKHWQRWSRRQLAIVGNVIFTPEQKGMGALLGEPENVPAYPCKARPLADVTHHSVASLLADIHVRLEEQCSDYHHMLHAVYLFSSSTGGDEKTEYAVFQQWGLFPEPFTSIDAISPLFDNDFDGLILVLCAQLWQEGNEKRESEFVSAQLISSSLFAQQNSIPVFAGLGRVMPLDPEGIAYNMDILLEYNQLQVNELHHVWVTQTDETLVANIMQYADQRQWQLPKRLPVHLIDHSFGPASDMAFPLALAMLTDAANITGQDQLIIGQTLPQTKTMQLCLITEKLFSE